MNRDANRFAETLRLFLSVLASVAYLGGGIALIASSQSFGIASLEGPARYALAAFLIIYGAFRGFRAFQQFQNR